MFLKNDSKFQVGLRTKKQLLTFAPGQIEHVLDSDIISINSKLVKVSEEEYNNYIGNSKTLEVPSNAQKHDVFTEPVNDIQKDNITSDGQDNDNITNSEQNLEQNEISSKDTPNQDQKEIQTNNDNSNLVHKLEKLKIQWQNTNNAKKKETIAKQIKELSKKIK